MAEQAPDLSELPPADKPFDRILNFRHVGKTINDLTGSEILREGQLFRSARPDEASLEDRRRLVEDYGIRTVIDLRTKSEHIAQARKHASNSGDPDAATAAAAATTTASTSPDPQPTTPLPLQIPGLTYLPISLNGPAFERSLFAQLPYWDRVRLVTLMAFGYRARAIAILGRSVLQPRGLVGLACDSLEYSVVEIRECFAVLARGESFPVLVHCTQGKDRTGLVVLLVLLLCSASASSSGGNSIPLAAIKAEYSLSEAALQAERVERTREIEGIGLTGEQWAGCPADWVERVVAFVEERWGGVEGYLREWVGVEDETIKGVEACLVAGT